MRGERHTDLVVPVPLDVVRAMADKRQAEGGGPRALDELRTRRATRREGVVGSRRLYGLGSRATRWRTESGPGARAALSHEAAAHLWTLLPTQPPFIDVTTRQRRPRSGPGPVVHSGDVDVMRHEGLHGYVVIRSTWPQLRNESADRDRADRRGPRPPGRT